MTLRLSIALLAIALLSIAPAAQAVPKSGVVIRAGHLLNACNLSRGTGAQLDRNFCLGYMFGFIARQRLIITVGKRTATARAICLKPEIRPTHLLVLLTNRLNQRPADIDEPADVVLWQELARAFPCGRVG